MLDRRTGSVGFGGAGETASPLVEDDPGAAGSQRPKETGRSEESQESEATTSKAMGAPTKPTAAMVEDREVSHLPFRNWCAHCIRGRGASQGHYKQHHDEEQTPTMSVDYAFFGAPGKTPAESVADHENPILVGKDRATKRVLAKTIPSKGVENPYATKVLAGFLESSGYKKVVLKSDQEPSMVSVCKAARKEVDVEIVPEHSPVGESQSNGDVERAVQSVQGLARTIKDALETKLGDRLNPKGPIMAWLVDHSGVLLNLFHVDSGGMTPYHRWKGKPWKIPLPSFGEVVEFRRKTAHKLEPRWERGIFLGVKETTTEKIVGNKSGIYVVQSLRRKPAGDRFSTELVDEIEGLPWNPNRDSRTPEPPSSNFVGNRGRCSRFGSRRL